MLFVHAVAVGLILLGHLVIDDVATFLIFGGVIAFVTYSLIGANELRRCPIWFDPISVYFLWYSIVFGACAIYAGIYVGSGKGFTFVISDIDSETLPWALCVCLLGTLAFHFGLSLFRPARSSDPAATEESVGGMKWIVLLWALGQVAFWVPSLFTWLGNIRTALRFGSIGAASSLALRSSAELGIGQSTFRACFLIANAGTLLAGFASGMKADIMFALLPTAWFFLREVQLGLVKTRMIGFVLGAITLYLIILYPMMTGYRRIARTEYRGSTTPLLDIYDAWSSGAAQVAAGAPSDEMDQTFARLSQFIPVAYFVAHVRVHGLQFGATMNYARYAFVPRIIWPDKPNLSRGAWFSVYLGFARSEDKGFSVAQTATGELYWNFGSVGVFLGMLLIGAINGLIWRTAGLDPTRRPLNITFYTIVLCNLGELPEAVTSLTGALANLIILKLGLLLIHQWSITSEKSHPRSDTLRHFEELSRQPQGGRVSVSQL
jgi:hypothetical protein